MEDRTKGLTLEVDVVNTGSAFFGFDILFEPSLHASLFLLKFGFGSVGNEWCAREVISSFWLGDVDSVEDRVDLSSLDLVSNPVSQQRVARLGLEFHDTLLGVTRDLDAGYAFLVDDLVYKSTIFGGEVIEAHDIYFVDNKDGRFVGKEGFDRMEEFALGLDTIAALLAEIHKVQNTAFEMRKSSDTLHLDGVHFLERVVEDPRGIDDLPSQVLVVEVTDKKRLGRERVRLHINVRTRDLVDEGRLSNVGIPADE